MKATLFMRMEENRVQSIFLYTHIPKRPIRELHEMAVVALYGYPGSKICVRR